MAASREDGLTYTMTFSCLHESKSKKITLAAYNPKDDGNKWFRMCPECGEKLNWSPKLKAWMSESDWTEYRNDRRKAAGLDPE